MTKPELVYVDAFLLFSDKCNVRSSVTVPQELVESIRQMGIIEPLVARKVDGRLSVIAGGRRMVAAQEIGLKNVPVLVREISDVDALGLSLSENLQRNNLTSIETAEAIADLWDLLEGKSEEKYKVIEEKFGIGKPMTARYLSISRLSDEIKSKVSTMVDTAVLADVSNEKNWTEENKAEVIDVLGEVPSSMSAVQKRELVKDMRELAQEEGLSPKEAYEKIMTEKEEQKSDSFDEWKSSFRFRREVKVRFFEKCKKIKKNPEVVVAELIERWLE